MRPERPRRDVKREKAAEASRLFRMAYARQLEGDLDHARLLYEKSLRLHPNAEAHVHLGWTKAAEGDLDEAIAHCKAAIALDPAFANAWNDLGAYLIEAGAPEDSLFFLKRATRLRQYASRCFPHFNLHRAYLAMGDRARAVDHLHDALEADPDFTPAIAALTDLMFGERLSTSDGVDDDLADWLRDGTPVLAQPPALS